MMRCPPPALLGLSVALVLAPFASVHAQWEMGVELGATRYGGSSRDTAATGGPESFRPGDATMVGLRVMHRFGRAAAALRVAYAHPGLTATAASFVASDRSSGELVEMAGWFSIQVARVGPSGAVRAEVGPALHLWNLDKVRGRLGALGALAYEWPVASRFTGAVRLEGGVSRSWFNDGEPPPEYGLRPTWRYGVTLGLRYRL